MARAPASKKRNDPQTVLKSLATTPEISMNVTKKVSGDELERIFQGVSAFTKAFNPADEYEVAIRLDKLEPATKAASSEFSGDGPVIGTLPRDD